MEQTFIYQHFAISFNEYGKGMPVMLLHGFGEDSRIFASQVKDLQNKYRVIVPDLPGTGKSLPAVQDKAQCILTGLPSDIDKMADALIAFAKWLGVDKMVLLGHSMGGYIALSMAEKCGGILAAFGLIHSTAFADSEEKKATRQKGIAFVTKNGGYAFLKTTTPGLFSEHFKEINPDAVNALVEQFNPAFTESANLDAALIAYYTAMINRPDRTEVLKKATVPVLFIVGTEDKAVPAEDMLKQSHMPQTAYVHILQNNAHMSMLEQPYILNTRLNEFIDNCRVQ